MFLDAFYDNLYEKEKQNDLYEKEKQNDLYEKEKQNDLYEKEKQNELEVFINMKIWSCVMEFSCF